MRGKWKVFFALSLALLRPLSAAEPAAWRVWLEPKFSHAAQVSAIAGAQRTELAAGTLEIEGLVPAGSLPAPFEKYLSQAVQNAAADLDDVTITYVRDSKRVIRYAELGSPKNLLPSAVLSPKFLARFQDTLGPAVILLLPSRSTGFVFPKLASSYRDHASAVVETYRAATFPVSREVFELGPDGLKAIGLFPDPGRD